MASAAVRVKTDFAGFFKTLAISPAFHFNYVLEMAAGF
jgi:hypothetical protein